MQIVGSAKLFPAMAFCSANTPAWWDLSLGYLNCWREKEKKKSFTFSASRRFLSESQLMGSNSHICHHILMFLQESGRRPMHWSVSKKQWETKHFHKRKNMYIFLKTQYHTDDWSSWLNHCWKMKIFCISATVPTGGWNSGHLPNHQEFLHDWQATVSHCTLQL